MDPMGHDTKTEFFLNFPEALSSVEMRRKVKSTDGYVNWEVVLHMVPHASRTGKGVLLNLEAVAFSPNSLRPYTKKFVYASWLLKSKGAPDLCDNCRRAGYTACGEGYDYCDRSVGQIFRKRSTGMSVTRVESTLTLAEGPLCNNFLFKMSNVEVADSSFGTGTHDGRTCRFLVIEVTLRHFKSDEDVGAPNVQAAASIVSTNLQAMLDSGALSDVSFLVGDEEVKAHRVVLGAASDVFKAMFETDTQDSRTGRIHVEDSQADAFRAMLRCLYTGAMPAWTEEDDDFLMGVLNLAEKYNLGPLHEECQRRILCTMSVDNVVERLKAVNILSPSMVPLLADPFVRSHFSEILSTEEWTAFMKDDVHLAAQVMYNAMKR
ncbi:uncharacterized protein LOC117653678 isoform X2 [Thrips palmi]|nr:uncharacterized protein LOC117653678 isoform X2 [Thrips palmi]XP_034255395.1 uncharacterized protein LOC117653678 isoform X2 [Thrips palmi]XP_034255396.1 uncharacterized protein LOC117653678 isoform X2 [Thrips palmi]XP_034255397.1 uncharacterized protein LOC117653678 isoform X2 [Thrips palmi]XP_034255399.1 uncharacterized protein LOC117653678 isoform X2 [Thrips palmi]XP_034255400.1 uncharacterized protein LOC117653678 isoform X2 [Thrips palmi]XP_034255401.1 uncharacterized protein LOC11765